MKLPIDEMREFLDEKFFEYNTKAFIKDDPVQIPHIYSLKEDIEIAGFLTATIAWGKRGMIIKNANRMMELLGNSPYDFVMNHNSKQLDRFENFVHRTFNSTDMVFFIKSLQNIYKNRGGLESIFKENQTDDSLQNAIHALHNTFFEIPHLPRTRKHVANPKKGSVAKRINLFLRWMIRADKIVDFGLWDISPSKLSCPLDVHSGNIARKLGLITIKANSKKALKELDENLRLLDPNDPVKYDYALFGLGVYDDF